LPGLDTLRALAILAVMMFHLESFLPERFGVVGDYGWMGVDLFFVLSGYLIGTQLLKPYRTGGTLSLADFYRRRAWRILPAYLVVVALYFTVPVWRESANISPLWMFLTFTQNLFIDYSINHAFSFAWSLCVEEHFYLLLPLIVMVMMRRPALRRTVVLLAAITAAGIGIRTFVLFHELRHLGENLWISYFEHIYYPTYAHLDGLVAGVSLALVKIFRPAWWTRIARHGHAIMVAGIAAVGVSVWLFADRFASTTGVAAAGTIIGFPVLSLGLVLLVASSISNRGLLSRFAIAGAKPVATLAFSLYLTHKEIAHLDQLYLPRLTQDRGVIATLTYAITCFGAAAVLYYAVERPGILLRDRRQSLSGSAIPRETVSREMESEPAL
jgi:peptidoglycan/LPS O-acetylase OafA/YrhL